MLRGVVLVCSPFPRNEMSVMAWQPPTLQSVATNSCLLANELTTPKHFSQQRSQPDKDKLFKLRLLIV